AYEAAGALPHGSVLATSPVRAERDPTAGPPPPGLSQTAKAFQDATELVGRGRLARGGGPERVGQDIGGRSEAGAQALPRQVTHSIDRVVERNPALPGQVPDRPAAVNATGHGPVLL